MSQPGKGPGGRLPIVISKCSCNQLLSCYAPPCQLPVPWSPVQCGNGNCSPMCIQFHAWISGLPQGMHALLVHRWQSALVMFPITLLWEPRAVAQDAA
jgi:hypothetical protein